MPSLRDFIRPRDVHPRLAAQTRRDTLRALIAGLRDHPGIVSFETIAREIEAKADSLDTVIEGCVWLPHLRSASARGIIVCGGSWAAPAALDFPPGGPAGLRLVILILAQQGLVTEYLAAVGELARRLSQPGTPERMADAAAGAEWITALLG